MNNSNNSQSLYQSLWNAADILRGKMDANEYKSYLLGLIFYKYLSDKLLLAVCDNLDESFDSLSQAQALYEENFADPDVKEDLLDVLDDELGYFIDASKEFDKGKNQNIMTDDHIAKILKVYEDRQDVDKFAHLASFEEIVENDYNLNIPRYVDTFEEEPVIPLTELADKLAQTDKEIAETTAQLETMLAQLVGTTPEAQAELSAFLDKIR